MTKEIEFDFERDIFKFIGFGYGGNILLNFCFIIKINYLFYFNSN